MSIERLLQATVKAGGQELRLIPGRRIVIVTAAGEREVQGAGADGGHDRPAPGPGADAGGAPGAWPRGRAEWRFQLAGVGPVRARAETREGATHAGFAVGDGAPRRRRRRAARRAAPRRPRPRRRGRRRRAAPATARRPRWTSCSGRWSSMKGLGPPHLRRARRPWCGTTARSSRCPAAPCSTAADTERILWPIAPERNREEFKRRHDTDFAYEIPGLARFRCNFFLDRKGMGGVFRVIPTKIITAEEMGLSKEILQLCHLPKGLVLVTGPDGLRQVDDALRAHRLHQPQPHRPHHHHRGPARVRAREQEVPDQPAPGRRAHRLVQGRAARRPARGPGHRAGRRDARPGDGGHRHRDRGDRATSSSARCTPRPRPRRSTASSTSSRPTGRSRSASCSRRASRA